MAEQAAQATGPSEFGRWGSMRLALARACLWGNLQRKPALHRLRSTTLRRGRSQNPQDRTRKKLADALGEQPTEEVINATEASATVEDVGEFLDFDPHDESGLPDEPGVYVFYDISDRPIYVGQSRSIRDRILNSHTEKFWFKAPVVQNAAYVRIEDEALRKKIEKVMIKLMKSTAVINKQYVERKA